MILILLPAYNEEQSIPRLMSKLQNSIDSIEEEFKIIVCNDGSNDQTRDS